MREGRGFEAGYGTAEAAPGDTLAQRIETGPEKPKPRVEYGPDDSDIIFVWNGKEYKVVRLAASVGSIICIDSSEKGDESSWICLKVTRVSDDHYPKIESLEIHPVRLKSAAIKLFIRDGTFIKAEPKK